MHVDDYPPEWELDSITHGSEDLPDGAGGLTLRQRATIALLRNGARRHVPRPQLECEPLCQLSYLHASYATNPDWGLGDTSAYVSEVPTPSPPSAPLRATDDGESRTTGRHAHEAPRRREASAGHSRLLRQWLERMRGRTCSGGEVHLVLGSHAA